MNELSKARATMLEVGEESVGQRIDNFLIRNLKGVPKSHVYRILRSGEVRVNSGRIKPDYRLVDGDKVRVPPVRVATPEARPPARSLALPVVFEDDALIVIDKPSGVAVHGGSGISFGVIESLRAERPRAKFLELAHRLDRDTSGLLMVGKKRTALVELHRMLRDGEVRKDYVAIVKGRWKGGGRKIDLPLHKYVTAEGERRVSVRDDGQQAISLFKPLAAGDTASMLDIRLMTGRTHQIRVHAAHVGHPILGDDKYGDFDLNRALVKQGVKRLFLHARQLSLSHPISGEPLAFVSPLPPEMQRFLDTHINAPT
ncbi:MAG: RluA family pseudouridine synthase [Betaproteobacteria bacterium]|nr:RluA family pseudouridine synthase [Betaproteobacteria bacterium]